MREQNCNTSGAPRSRKLQMALTLTWLEENYCPCEGVCLPRGIVYEHYLEFCRKHSLEPACKATFGKVIRLKFPEVTSKRLGARGHSKYHYHGIGIRESSEYYHSSPENTGLTRFSGATAKSEGGFTRRYSLSSRTGTLLPNFPEIKNLIVPCDVPDDKVKIFLSMYKTHCQCVLDTAICGSFEEIRCFLLHFWQGLPDHLLPLVENEFIVDVIAICDWVLYKTLLDVLIPATMQEMPENLLCSLRSLAHKWEEWVISATENLPQLVVEAKNPLAQLFAQSLKRQVSFLHLAQTVRPVLYDIHLVQRITADVDQIDVASLMSQALYASEDDGDLHLDASLLTEFKEQFRHQATVENLIEWLDQILDQRVIKPSKDSRKLLRIRAQNFLLKWSFFGSRIMYSLTMNGAESFASFHLLRMFLDEYLLLAIESQLEADKEDQVWMRFSRNLRDFVPQSSYFTSSRSNGVCKMVRSSEGQLDDSIGQLVEQSQNGTLLMTPPTSPCEKFDRIQTNAGKLECNESTIPKNLQCDDTHYFSQFMLTQENGVAVPPEMSSNGQYSSYYCHATARQYSDGSPNYLNSSGRNSLSCSEESMASSNAFCYNYNGAKNASYSVTFL